MTFSPNDDFGGIEDDVFGERSVRRLVNTRRPVSDSITSLLRRLEVSGGLAVTDLGPEERALMHVLVTKGQVRLAEDRYLPPLFG
jgi:hypothetical protein